MMPRRGRGPIAWLLVATAVLAPAGHTAQDVHCRQSPRSRLSEAPPDAAPRPLAAPLRTALPAPGGRRDAWLYLAATGADAAPTRLVAVDPRSGALLWSAAVPESAALAAPGQPAPALLRDHRELARRAYLGDAAGNLWRIDFPDGGGAGAPRFIRVADLVGLAAPGGSVAIDVTPDVFRALDSEGHAYDGVVVAVSVRAAGRQRIDLVLLRDYVSGGHERPRAATTVSDLTRIDDCRLPSRPCAVGRGPGWYRQDVLAGDRPLAAPLVDGGRVFLGAYDSAALDCDALTAPLFATVIDLRSGESQLDDERFLALGQQPLAGPAVVGDRVMLPGLLRAVRERGLAPDLLRARGLGVRRLYRRDLLLDAE